MSGSSLPQSPSDERGTVCPSACPSLAASPRPSAPRQRPTSERLLSNALFEEDYDDTILRKRGQLKHMISYVSQNPWRKWLKVHKPEWLCPVRGIEINGRLYDAIGNINLLALSRWQVHVRYKWLVPETAEGTQKRRDHQNECVMKARHNYALVSPFVNPHEAAVRDFCLKEGHSIIQIQDNGFTDFTQCPPNLLEYCNQGQVLLLVPSNWPHIDNKSITKAECRILNSYAEEICNE